MRIEVFFFIFERNDSFPTFVGTDVLSGACIYQNHIMPGKPNKKNSAIRVSANPVVAAGGKDIFGSMPKWAPVAVLLLTAVIYSRGIPNDLVNIDDDAFILKNPLVRDLSWHGLKAIFTNFQNGKYQPFVNLSFLLEYKSFGFNPVVFHLTNVLLHLASTWVVYKFTEGLSGKRFTALVVAVLFGIHPMHVEEVVWAAERKDVLYALFYLLAMLYYLKYLREGMQVKHFVGVFLLFLASVFSKSTAMTLPVILLAIDIYKGRKMNVRAWLEKAPFALVAVVFAILGTVSQQSEGMVGQMPEAINFINRVFLFTYVPVFYIVKLFFPVGLSVMHYYPDVTDGYLPWEYYASMPVLLFLVVFIAWVAVKRPSFRKEMLFGVAFFVITICIMEQIVGVGPSLTPERYTYIPYIGLFYIIGQWLSGFKAGKQEIPVIVFTVFLIFFCAQTWARIDVWKDSDAVFKDVIEKNNGVSDRFEYYFMNGDIKAGGGDLKGAIADYDQAISLNPAYAEAYTNRGAVYFQLGDGKSAMRDLDKAIALKPKRAKPYTNRAAVEATAGDFAAALRDYDHFLALDSNDNRGYADRGMVRLALGDSTGACKDWKKSLELGNTGVADLLKQYCH